MLGIALVLGLTALVLWLVGRVIRASHPTAFVWVRRARITCAILAVIVFVIWLVLLAVATGFIANAFSGFTSAPAVSRECTVPVHALVDDVVPDPDNPGSYMVCKMGSNGAYFAHRAEAKPASAASDGPTAPEAPAAPAVSAPVVPDTANSAVAVTQADGWPHRNAKNTVMAITAPNDQFGFVNYGFEANVGGVEKAGCGSALIQPGTTVTVTVWDGNYELLRGGTQGALDYARSVQTSRAADKNSCQVWTVTGFAPAQ